MRRLAMIVVGFAALGGSSAIALAQSTSPITMTVDATVTPNKAGTKQHPQGVKLAFTATFQIPEAYDPPLVDRVTVLFPKGGLYNGAKHPRCSENTLARRGVAGCPKGSIMGKGTAKAMADDVPTYPKITIVNGGPTRVYFYTVMTNPARVQVPVVGKVTKLSGRWSYRLETQIPKSLQIVAGIPIVLHELTMAGGKGDWIATTSCPADKRWPYHVEGLFTTGETIVYDDAVACR
ncbi:MAG TPA: hypothetical protein VK631_02140 [Solirubrobacteraceae bacterium]|nr:hypothetical protein [Solirubrobacteraceae bacterium]